MFHVIIFYTFTKKKVDKWTMLAMSGRFVMIIQKKMLSKGFLYLSHLFLKCLLCSYVWQPTSLRSENGCPNGMLVGYRLCKSRKYLHFCVILQWRPGYQGHFGGEISLEPLNSNLTCVQEATNFNRFTFHSSIHFSGVGFVRQMSLTNLSFSWNNAAPNIRKFLFWSYFHSLPWERKMYDAHNLYCVCVLTLS